MAEPAEEPPVPTPGPDGRWGRGFLAGVMVLLVCQLVGEAMVRTAGVSFPGPVVGMVIFAVVLGVTRPTTDAALTRAPSALLRHLQLLFVPAGVGIMESLRQLREDAVPIAVGLWASWLVGLIVIGLLLQAMLKLLRRWSHE